MLAAKAAGTDGEHTELRISLAAYTEVVLQQVRTIEVCTISIAISYPNFH